MAVKVQFQIGHTSKLRSKKTVEGFTHDWELYVKGVERAEINLYVEKVVFNLHASFSKPKRAIKEPPYIIQESGYAGFILPIDIYFRNRDEPKRVQFAYDLDLQQTGPPHHRYEIKKFIFENPSEELRLKLIKGGGVPVAGVVGRNINAILNNTSDQLITNSVGDNDVKGNTGLADCTFSNKQKISGNEGKKYKPRCKDEAKSSSFANLFGTPVQKSSPDPKIDNGTICLPNSPLFTEKFNREKEHSEKTRENFYKKDRLHKSNISQEKSGIGANGKPDKSERTKHKLADKGHIKCEKAENTSKHIFIHNPVHSPKKIDFCSRARGEDFKKVRVENIDGCKKSVQSSSGQIGKKSKKEKKEKDRYKESNAQKYLNVRETSIDNQSFKDLLRNEELSYREIISSPLLKQSVTSNPFISSVKTNETPENKNGATQKKLSSEKEIHSQSSKSCNNFREREGKSSHRYKKKNKSKETTREKNEKMKTTVGKCMSSRDLNTIDSKRKATRTASINATRTPMANFCQYSDSKIRTKENLQSEEIKGNKLNLSNESRKQEKRNKIFI